jgi:hypothetical protein
VLQLIQDRNGFQWLEVGVCTRGQIELNFLEGQDGGGTQRQWLEGFH